MGRDVKKVLRVGLTGGIASGKSLVADMFAELGVPVIDTDRIARDVVAPGQPALREIRTQFGPDVILPSGELDRRRLRRLIADRSLASEPTIARSQNSPTASQSRAGAQSRAGT